MLHKAQYGYYKYHLPHSRLLESLFPVSCSDIHKPVITQDKCRKRVGDLKYPGKTVTSMAAISRQSVQEQAFPFITCRFTTFWIQKQMLLRTAQTTNNFLTILKKTHTAWISLETAFQHAQLQLPWSDKKQTNQPRKTRNKKILLNLSEDNSGQTCKSHSLMLTFTFVGKAATQCIRKDYLRQIWVPC